ncbi:MULTISPECIES: helix-turn-helix domain-containing protein [unclassified Variovorax]|jgi:cytoskeleton protein RodZ|uniref:helix-turn-helix domain-containing protein n=1 Tax=unclassified Variovorax TaxID=663243 RepID=UPI000F7F8C7A|nr:MULTISPECIES: helix-turn-helix domain-containing protein [unclassified Variovorax]RSZ39518.1 helix-turn-helix domain-containing protein [Variovorax sp. 553]RSZ40778.1 helix-turn-helix domain-containing protein [Variovorax sp. 679]
MTDRVSEFGTSAALPLDAGDNANKTAGDLLREAREAHGLHIEMVAAALKVPPQKLMALEADDIASLPDPVFARALASSVCRALRIDPAPVLAKLPSTQKVSLAETDRTLRANIGSGTPRWNGNGRSSGLPSRALLTVVVLLLIGAGAMFWLPQSVFDQLSASVARLTARGDAGTESAPTNGPASAGGSVAETVPTQAVAPTGPVAGETPTAAPAPNALAAVAAAPVATAPAATPVAAASSSQQLVFVAREECWITVTEAGGKQLLRRSLQAGETVGLSGTLPLSVVIGRASSVDVQVRGQPFDLKPFTKGGGVARFEVKS